MIGNGNTATIEGTVDRVVYHNPNNGWTVLRLQSKDAALLQTVVGRFQELSPGERASFQGRWVNDLKHGRQFEAATCLPLEPATVIGIEKFLGSGLVSGIGPVTAKRIVSRLGVDTLGIIEKNPEKLASIPGIGPKRAKSIQKALVDKKAIRDVMVFLESAGVSPALAHRIYRRFGNDSIRIVKENPFRLASDVSGIGFLSADKIAEHLGVSRNSQHRAEAGVLYALEELAKEGHVYAEQESLLSHAANLLNIPKPELERAVDRLMLMGKIRREAGDREDAIYLPRLFDAERDGARMVASLLSSPSFDFPVDTTGAIAAAEEASGLALADEQKRAFGALVGAKLLVLTGGPGTGKTTLLKGIVSCLIGWKIRVAMAAPTGRAARRMTEATGHEAKTIHRLLEFTPKTMHFEKNQERPIDAQVVIIDEFSMVDIELFTALLCALKPGTRLILVGDPDQLPSVGPGTVLNDVLQMGRHPEGVLDQRLVTVRLTEIFRQAHSSLIVTGAHDILRGEMPKTGSKGEKADLFLIEREEPEACLTVVEELVAERIPARFGLDSLEDIQILAPMHKGILGVANLNEQLQKLLNPETRERRSIISGGSQFRVGDKVMQQRNNYDLEVFNGDIGRVAALSPELDWLDISFPERIARYPVTELSQLTLAYACSVHKSQGSEYPVVIIPVHTQHFVMLQRNLLYTAITRGKKLVVLVGTKRALNIAIRNDKQTYRASRLIERVTAEFH